jgi:hypothetical protein
MSCRAMLPYTILLLRHMNTESALVPCGAHPTILEMGEAPANLNLGAHLGLGQWSNLDSSAQGRDAGCD